MLNHAARAAVRSSYGYTYFGRGSPFFARWFSASASFTILVRSGAVRTASPGSMFVRNDVATHAPFSYVMPALVVIAQTPSVALKMVSCGPNRKNRMPAAWYVRTMWARIENGGLSTTAHPSGYASRSKSAPGQNGRMMGAPSRWYSLRTHARTASYTGCGVRQSSVVLFGLNLSTNAR